MSSHQTKIRQETCAGMGWSFLSCQEILIIKVTKLVHFQEHRYLVTDFMDLQTYILNPMTLSICPGNMSGGPGNQGVKAICLEVQEMSH